MEKNNICAAYTHKAEDLEQHRLMLQWWATFLDANRKVKIWSGRLSLRIIDKLNECYGWPVSHCIIMIFTLLFSISIA